MKTDKFLLLLPLLAFMTMNVNAQTVKNPFKKLGYDVLMATSSKGEFAEFHDQEDIVEIGSVLYDTKKKEIVKILPKDSTTIYISSATAATSIDPHCERYYWISPYVYTMNNPIKFIDPDGRDVYRFDDKTGQFTLAVKNDDKFDQVGKFKYDKKTDTYTLQTNKKGEAKTRIDKIEKGILNDGINFKDNDNVIAVGGKNQASVEGVRDFVVELSEMINKEIGGYEYMKNGETNTSSVYVSQYKNNNDQKAYSPFSIKTAKIKSTSDITINTHFHTHLERFPTSSKLVPSGIHIPGGDMEFKKQQTPNGIRKFIILTRGYDPIPY
ncbi:MAG: hypothetical protein E6767_13790 [Dysgonomonas sp.]|nr:hypothetical protein [Dysgonomonas sp.]